MYRRFRVGDYVVYGLVLLGVLLSLIKNFFVILIPVVIIGGILWYNRYLSKKKASSPQYYRNYANKAADNKKKNTKNARFRVIRGSKQDDEEHQYH